MYCIHRSICAFPGCVKHGADGGVGKRCQRRWRRRACGLVGWSAVHESDTTTRIPPPLFPTRATERRRTKPRRQTERAKRIIRGFGTQRGYPICGRRGFTATNWHMVSDNLCLHPRMEIVPLTGRHEPFAGNQAAHTSIYRIAVSEVPATCYLYPRMRFIKRL